MTAFNALLDRFAAVRLDDLDGFDREAALQAGLSPARVSEWQLVHEAYFGQTNAPARQLAAAEAARSCGASVDMLAQIERSIKHVGNLHKRNALRMRLIGVARTAATCKALARLAKSIVPKRTVERIEGVRFTGSVGSKRSMTVTADEHLMADLEAAFRRGLPRDAPAAPHMLKRFKEVLIDGTGIPTAAPRPQLLVPLNQHVKILCGDGDDVILGLTNGTTMTGAQYLNRFVATQAHGLEAALFHPTEGAVNLYRAQRFANQKQRDLARAVQPVCVSPDCRHGADNCDIHHITAWKNGGATNLNNLAPLCRYHNRVNDDDAYRRKRGRVEMRRGSPIWVSPLGFARPNKRHPFGAMHLLFG